MIIWPDSSPLTTTRTSHSRADKEDFNALVSQCLKTQHQDSGTLSARISINFLFNDMLKNCVFPSEESNYTLEKW